MHTSAPKCASVHLCTVQNLTVENVSISHIECFASKLKPGDCLGNKEKGALSSTVHRTLLNFERRKSSGIHALFMKNEFITIKKNI